MKGRGLVTIKKKNRSEDSSIGIKRSNRRKENLRGAPLSKNPKSGGESCDHQSKEYTVQRLIDEKGSEQRNQDPGSVLRRERKGKGKAVTS